MNAYEKMREALVNTLDALKSLSKSHSTDLPEDVRALLGGMAFTVNAALAEPRRNCDVGTAKEQAQRFETFCSLHHLPNGKGCYSCPAIPGKSPHAFHRDACRANWNQMPYKEGGDK